MSVTAKRKTTIVYSGDVGGTEEIAAVDNTSSPGSIQLVYISASGATSVTVPPGATGVTITKPSDNTNALNFYGMDNGNVPWRLHDTDPDSFSIHPNMTDFTIGNAGSEDVYLRLFWT